MMKLIVKPILTLPLLVCLFQISFADVCTLDGDAVHTSCVGVFNPAHKNYWIKLVQPGLTHTECLGLELDSSVYSDDLDSGYTPGVMTFSYYVCDSSEGNNCTFLADDTFRLLKNSRGVWSANPATRMVDVTKILQQIGSLYPTC